MAAAAAGTSLGAARGYKPALAAQFYIWVQKFDREKKSLAEGAGEAFRSVRRAGYKRIELMSNLFTDDARDHTLAAIRENGLEIPIVYNGCTMHEEAAAEKAIEENLKLAETIRPTGSRIIEINADGKPHGAAKTDAELAVQARCMTRLAEALKARGFGLLIHNHTPEMENNAREWRAMLRDTPAGFCLDLHWVYRAGQDPLGLLREAGKRVGGLHLRNSQRGVWTEAFGDGDMDYRPIAAYLKESGYSGYLMVELAYEKDTQVTRPLEEDLRISREYAQKLFGVKA